MKFCIFGECDWMYPDSGMNGAGMAELDLPRAGHAGFQVLGEEYGEEEEGLQASFIWEESCAVRVELYELTAVGVGENTAPGTMTTSDYESCRSYVTRKAPFRVYDALRPYRGTFTGGRPALYVRLEADRDAVPGIYQGKLCLQMGKEKAEIPVRCKVYHAAVPEIAKARLGMMNFLSYGNIASQHGVKKGDAEYWELFRRYVRAQLSMRCTHIQLPAGEAVYEKGKPAGFDFSTAERAGRIAVEEGAPFLCGGHVAHWKEWTQSEYYPNWDKETGISTQEGYLQLKRYFSGWAEVIRRNGWESRMTQSLADEPQIHNASAYRILAGICRKFLPGVPILDAVETTELGGGIDIWVPKLETYEKNREAYDVLKRSGESMWFYTCAFPGGNAMNRSMDLPLCVSRALLWMAARYRFDGYLHWGFNFFTGKDLWKDACCPRANGMLPAGDAHVVYPGEDGPLLSMRYEMQRAGAQDYELLMQLAELLPKEADDLMEEVCRDYRTYTADGNVLLACRKKLLERLDGLKTGKGEQRVSLHEGTGV